jgi:uncharacterized protein (TIGR02147 family)
VKDFRLHLQDEFLSRCRRNPKYSLRAFARSLGVNHGILSTVLRNKRPLTARLVQELGFALRLGEKELNAYVRALPDFGESPVKKTTRIKQINQMTVDTFNVVSDWYHDAILELSRLRDFQGTPKYIAKKLGISTTEARLAIERLERIGLIEIGRDGSWKETLGDNTTAWNVDVTSPALRHLQRQVLGLSLRALEEIPRAEREHACMTMAVRARDLAEAKRRIKAFRHELMSFLQRDGAELDEVYQLAVSLYPLTRREQKGRRKSESLNERKSR